MRHRNIETKIWDDSWFSDLDPIEKLLFIYLFTNNRATLCGIYELPVKIMSTETGIEKDMLIKIISRFEEKGKVIYFKGFIALKNSEKYQSESPSIKIGIQKEKALIPKDILAEIDRVWGGCREGVVTVAKSRVEESRVEESSKDMRYAWFDEFYSSYPNKKSKKKAEQSYVKIKGLNEEIAKIILGALEKHKNSDQWKKDKGKFIPHPSTWINQERWNDVLDEKTTRVDHY